MVERIVENKIGNVRIKQSKLFLFCFYASTFFFFSALSPSAFSGLGRLAGLASIDGVADSLDAGSAGSVVVVSVAEGLSVDFISTSFGAAPFTASAAADAAAAATVVVSLVPEVVSVVTIVSLAAGGAAFSVAVVVFSVLAVFKAAVFKAVVSELSSATFFSPSTACGASWAAEGAEAFTSAWRGSVTGEVLDVAVTADMVD